MSVTTLLKAIFLVAQDGIDLWGVSWNSATGFHNSELSEGIEQPSRSSQKQLGQEADSINPNISDAYFCCEMLKNA